MNRAFILTCVITVSTSDSRELEREVAGTDAADTVVLVRAVDGDATQSHVVGVFEIYAVTTCRSVGAGAVSDRAACAVATNGSVCVITDNSEAAGRVFQHDAVRSTVAGNTGQDHR